jgi:hypothetical protein
VDGDSTERSPVDLSVLLFPADRRAWTASSPRIRVARPATDWTFVFDDALPGEYRVALVRDLVPGTELSVLEEAAAASVAVSVTRGADVVLDLLAGRTMIGDA